MAIRWIWRDISEHMWLGDINLNNPSDLFKYKMRWKINNKPASIAEKRAEWLAVRQAHLGFRVDEQTFEPLTALYFIDDN